MTKPAYPDDIKKGDWLVVTNLKVDPPPQISHNGDTVQIPFAAMMPKPTLEVSGIPFKVQAVSLPLVVGHGALSPERIDTIDLARYVVRKPSAAYVKVFVDFYKTHIVQHGRPQIVQ